MTCSQASFCFEGYSNAYHSKLAYGIVPPRRHAFEQLYHERSLPAKDKVSHLVTSNSAPDFTLRARTERETT
jgi:hypothetical protein